ncbi:MAG: pyridoxal phosphate-dependent aminotransferase [Bacteroidetes bacterium]|nr:pyridoxal phosphate-dependent aminotransferase [Bacteroidota bacterium]
MDQSVIQLLSDRVLDLQESATIKMSQMARDLREQGHNVISLSLGEPDFDTPDHIKEAAKKALDDGYTKYTPVPGLMEFRQAISRKFKRENELDYAPSQIVVSNGAKQSIANLSLSLLNPGDEVIIFAPYWVSYFEIVRLAGGVPVILSAGIDQDFKVLPEQLKGAITDKTKLVLFSSPCNPSGSVYSKEELFALADELEAHEQIHVLSDEIYEHINFSGKHASIGAHPGIKDRVVTINGMSKGFSMTGWRLGYMGAPQWIADACAKIQGQFTSGATSFGQKAAAEALDGDLGPTKEMCAAFAKRRELVIDLLSEVPGVKCNKPQGAFYVFPDISAYFGKTINGFTIQNSDDFCTYLLQEAHVAVVAGSAFGADECFRLSYAASEAELRDAIGRIKKALTA